MNRYIEQLIEDLNNAEASQITLRSHLDILGESETSDDDEDDEDNVTDIFKYFETAPLSEIIGFKKEVFPPENKLSDDQLELIYDHLVSVLDNYNFFLDFPENVPTRVKYDMLLSILENETTFSNAFVTSLEFCDYNYESCPFGIELCQCKKFEDLG